MRNNNAKSTSSRKVPVRLLVPSRDGPELGVVASNSVPHTLGVVVPRLDRVRRPPPLTASLGRDLWSSCANVIALRLPEAVRAHSGRASPNHGVDRPDGPALPTDRRARNGNDVDCRTVLPVNYAIGMVGILAATVEDVLIA
ncbi:hypothetical protein PHJA_000469700 [Phtheirospermum japonicum]|uniref:Uncharacterized protein n=1 Tax=Phtheirospermum japonicum TaxID=374723 RepID=A0A830BGA7_9LAMI|nr:hypothetical protein PHJA_000469700 [Phtheirospermum japonicum]